LKTVITENLPAGVLSITTHNLWHSDEVVKEDAVESEEEEAERKAKADAARKEGFRLGGKKQGARMAAAALADAIAHGESLRERRRRIQRASYYRRIGKVDPKL
jgi:hypothetical protein